MNFDVLHSASGNRYLNGDDIRLVNLGPIALFSNYKLTTSSEKHFEEINLAHIVSLMDKFLTSSRGSDDLSIGFDRSRDRRQQELTNNKKIKGKYHLRIYLKGIFVFADHQETASYGLGYRLTLTRNTNNAVLNRDNTTKKAKIKIIAKVCYVPHYTPGLKELNELMNQTTKKTPTNIHYPEKFVFMKEFNTQIFGFLN